jgi:hypothetical protein
MKPVAKSLKKPLEALVRFDIVNARQTVNIS